MPNNDFEFKSYCAARGAQYAYDMANSVADPTEKARWTDVADSEARRANRLRIKADLAAGGELWPDPSVDVLWIDAALVIADVCFDNQTDPNTVVSEALSIVSGQVCEDCAAEVVAAAEDFLI